MLILDERYLGIIIVNRFQRDYCTTSEHGIPNSYGAAIFHNKQYLFTNTLHPASDINTVCTSRGYDSGAVLDYLEEFHLCVLMTVVIGDGFRKTPRGGSNHKIISVKTLYSKGHRRNIRELSCFTRRRREPESFGVVKGGRGPESFGVVKGGTSFYIPSLKINKMQKNCGFLF